MSAEDPHWPRASNWLRRADEAPVGDLAVIGVPINQSITPGRCDLAPEAIRRALQRYSLFDCDTQTDLSQLRATDFGDVTQLPPELVARSARTVLLGGDNNVTRLGVHAMGVPLSRCGLITFDAHHDLRDLDGGLTNGNPIRGLLRDGLRGEHIIQIGIQPFANSAHYARLARDEGIQVFTADAIHQHGIRSAVTKALETLSVRTDVIYVDLDVDVLDRSCAPACAGARPGGLFPSMLRDAARLCGSHAAVKVLDIVEVDPTKDVADVTTLAAASFLLAFASGVQQRLQ